MECRTLAVWLVVAAALLGAASAGHCGRSLFPAMVGLIPCQPAVSQYIPSPPTEACCSAVRALGQPCVCMLLASSPIPGVDRTLAKLLPTKCGIEFWPCLEG